MTACASRPHNFCKACRLDFASLDAFDAHRTGEYQPNTRRCLRETEMRAATRRDGAPLFEWRADGRVALTLTDAQRRSLARMRPEPLTQAQDGTSRERGGVMSHVTENRHVARRKGGAR